MTASNSEPFTHPLPSKAVLLTGASRGIGVRSTTSR